MVVYQEVREVTRWKEGLFGLEDPMQGNGFKDYAQEQSLRVDLERRLLWFAPPIQIPGFHQHTSVSALFSNRYNSVLCYLSLHLPVTVYKWMYSSTGYMYGYVLSIHFHSGVYLVVPNTR
jgi:hypothetical protein